MKDQPRESSPTQDLRAYLQGNWTVERSLWDRASGTRGTFAGVVRYSETPDGGLLLREDGTMTWPTHTGPAFREYLLRPSDSPAAMDVYFPDGKPFHRMSFIGHANEDRHWCDPDDYRVTYVWGGPDAFSYAWDVHGPAKDLLLESQLRRAMTHHSPAKDLIVVSAVCVYDDAGRLLTVRKRGTDKFMHPGGKPEAGETAAEAASRELAEEVGIDVGSAELEPLGIWLAVAANEAATNIEATVFTAPGTWEAHPSAEIAEIRWLDLTAELPDDLAPLLTDHVLPELAQNEAFRRRS